MVANVQTLLLLQLILVLILGVCQISVDLDSRHSSLGRYCFLAVLLDVPIEVQPLLEHQLHVVHLVIGIKQSRHRVEKILVVVQVVHSLDLVQLELLLDSLVLEVLVAGQVDD